MFRTTSDEAHAVVSNRPASGTAKQCSRLVFVFDEYEITPVMPMYKLGKCARSLAAVSGVSVKQWTWMRAVVGSSSVRIRTIWRVLNQFGCDRNQSNQFLRKTREPTISSASRVCIVNALSSPVASAA